MGKYGRQIRTECKDFGMYLDAESVFSVAPALVLTFHPYEKKRGLGPGEATIKKILNYK